MAAVAHFITIPCKSSVAKPIKYKESYIFVIFVHAANVYATFEYVRTFLCIFMSVVFVRQNLRVNLQPPSIFLRRV